jgi:hypothetical protein
MAATSVNVEAGDYCGPSKMMQIVGSAMVVASKNTIKNTVLAKKLWAISCEMAGIDPFK